MTILAEMLLKENTTEEDRLRGQANRDYLTAHKKVRAEAKCDIESIAMSFIIFAISTCFTMKLKEYMHC